jgi:hypothetical protein
MKQFNLFLTVKEFKQILDYFSGSILLQQTLEALFPTTTATAKPEGNVSVTMQNETQSQHGSIKTNVSVSQMSLNSVPKI